MDKNQKFLKRLSAGELAPLTEALEKLNDGQTTQLDIKALRGHRDIFRLRVGKLRLIFLANRDRLEVLQIARRSEKTYRDF